MPGDNSFDREDILPPLERQYLEDVENPHDSRDYQDERRSYEMDLQRERGEKATTSSFRRYNNSSSSSSSGSYVRRRNSAQPGAGGEQEQQEDLYDDDMDQLQNPDRYPWYSSHYHHQVLSLFRVYQNNSNWF